MSDADLISISRIAKIHGRHRSAIHKIVDKLGMNSVKVASEETRGQKASHITMVDYQELERHLEEAVEEGHEDRHSGVFYLVVLEPDFDPGRFKVGFTTDLNERMRSHRTSVPFAKLVKTWPCKIQWEKTAIECITVDCEPLYTEVFRTDAIQKVIDRANRFFELMPKPIDKQDLHISTP